MVYVALNSHEELELEIEAKSSMTWSIVVKSIWAIVLRAVHLNVY